MMGTRGAVGLSQEATGLAMLADLIAMLKSADKTLPAAVADLRAAEADANSARDALDARQAKHDARQAELDTWHRELSNHKDGIQALEADLIFREDAARAQEAENSARQATFDGQTASIAQSMSGLVAREREIENMLKTAHQDILRQQETLRIQREASEQEIARAVRESAAAIQTARDKAESEIAKQRSLADEVIATDMESLRRREVRVVELEAAIHDRSAKLSEALSQI